MKRIIAIFCCLVLSAGYVGAQDSVPRFEETDCKVEVSNPDGITCGNLIVPADYSKPDGATTSVPVVRIQALDSNPLPDPFVMMQGGPGGSTIDAYAERMLGSAIRDTRDIYLIDQRGTLFADQYLFCQNLYDLTISILDVEMTTEESNAQYLGALTTCLKDFKGQGVNFADYTTAAYADDVASLRTAFGYDQYNLYGVSYGTQLAQFVMANDAEGLRSVILDAVVPVDVNDNFNVEKRADRVFDALFDACTADEECNRSYPNLKQVFYQTVDDLEKTPAESEVYDPNTNEMRPALIDGDTLISYLFQLHYATAFIPDLPAQIYNFSKGDFSYFTNYAGYFFLDQTFADAQYWATNCSDDPAPTEVDGIDNTDISPEVIAWNEGGDAATIEACKIIDVPQLDASSDQPITSSVPTLVLEGQFDPITPPVFGERVASNLPNSFYFEFPGIGHGSFTAECPDTIVSQFLDDPTKQPDASCIASMPVEFVTPLTTVTMVDYQNSDLGIAGLMPKNWREVSPGIIQRYLITDAPFIGYRVPDDGLEGYTKRIIMGGYGYDKLPEPADTIETKSNGLTWNLYEIEGQGLFAMFAFTEAKDGTAYIAVVGGYTEEERILLVKDALYPALEAFTLLQ